jgi:hypothetical protein
MVANDVHGVHRSHRLEQLFELALVRAEGEIPDK